MKKLLFSFITAALVFTGCNKTETSISPGTSGPGTLSVKITDDPFNISSVESATITISKIELRQVGSGDSATFLKLPLNPVTIDIFKLRNGITQELVNLQIPKGDYDLVRIYVDEANLKLKGIDEIFNLKVPSGAQTGIKVFVNPVIQVAGGISAELLLDFDLSKSFVMRGHDARNGFIFKPVIRATNTSTAGRIEGMVTDNSPSKVGLKNAKVFFMKDGADTVTTLTDTTGHYVFIGVPAGSYSMSATKDNYVSADAEGVVVIPGNRTTQNFVLKALPVYVSSVIDSIAPTILTITFNLPLANKVPDVSAFEVKVAAIARSVNTVAVSDNKVKLTLSSAVLKGEAVTVAYTKPATNPLQTADGLQVPSFTAQTVKNNVN